MTVSRGNDPSDLESQVQVCKAKLFINSDQLSQLQLKNVHSTDLGVSRHQVCLGKPRWYRAGSNNTVELSSNVALPSLCGLEQGPLYDKEPVTQPPVRDRNCCCC